MRQKLSEEEHKLRMRAQLRAWRIANLEKVRAHSRKSYLANIEKMRAASKAWRIANPEKVRAYRRKYRLANHEKMLARDREYNLANREKRLARSNAWKKAHPEAVRVIYQRRCARKHGLPDTLTAVEWQSICAAYRFRCAYCGKKAKLTMDHVVPLAKNGETTAFNIVPACRSCNSSKKNWPPPKPVNLAMGL